MRTSSSQARHWAAVHSTYGRLHALATAGARHDTHKGQCVTFVSEDCMGVIDMHYQTQMPFTAEETYVLETHSHANKAERVW
jgi:hypothetical protein